MDQAIVTDAQNCGNILAGVGPFAIERGLVKARPQETVVRIHMVNTGQLATATVQTPGGSVSYVWSLSRLSRSSARRLMGGLDFRLLCGRCQLYRCNQTGNS